MTSVIVVKREQVIAPDAPCTSSGTRFVTGLQSSLKNKT
jgi:hypothetical protein